MTKSILSDAVAMADTVPLQADAELARTRKIPRAIAQAAYEEYAARYGTDQSFERLHERGGFGMIELVGLLYDRIERLKQS